jgi:hypothetical protein
MRARRSSRRTATVSGVVVVVGVLLLAGCNSSAGASSGSPSPESGQDAPRGCERVNLSHYDQTGATHVAYRDVDDALAAWSIDLPTKPDCAVEVGDGAAGDYTELWWVQWSADTVHGVEHALEQRGEQQWNLTGDDTEGVAHYSPDGEVTDTTSELRWGNDQTDTDHHGTFRLALVYQAAASTPTAAPGAGVAEACPTVEQLASATGQSWIKTRTVGEDSCAYTEDGPSVAGPSVAVSFYDGDIAGFRAQAERAWTVHDAPSLGSGAFQAQTSTDDSGATCMVARTARSGAGLVVTQATAGAEGRLADVCAAALAAEKLVTR